MDKENNIVIAQVCDERSNAEVEFAVNRGLAAALLSGVPEGLKVMLEGGVPKGVCTRVLNSTTRRRSSDWK